MNDYYQVVFMSVCLHPLGCVSACMSVSVHVLDKRLHNKLFYS